MLMSMCILDSCHVVGKQEGADLILGYWWFPHGLVVRVVVYLCISCMIFRVIFEYKEIQPTHHTLVRKVGLNTHTNLNIERAGHRVPGPDGNKSDTVPSRDRGIEHFDRRGCTLTRAPLARRVLCQSALVLQSLVCMCFRCLLSRLCLAFRIVVLHLFKMSEQLSIFIWNVRGLNASACREAVHDSVP
jgi:hypothetical protein